METNDNIITLRAWLTKEIYERIASTNPNAEALRLAWRDRDDPHVEFFTKAVVDAEALIRALPEEQSELFESQVETEDELFKTLQTRLKTMGMTKTEVLNAWKTTPETDRRSRRKILPRIPNPLANPDLSWLWDETNTRDEVFERALFLRGFLSKTEIEKALINPVSSWWREQVSELQDVFSKAGLEPVVDSSINDLSDDDFKTFIESLVTFGDRARTEQIEGRISWYVFHHGIELEYPDYFENVVPEGLDARIAMWVRVFIEAGIATSISCAGHDSHKPYIRFGSVFDCKLAHWALLRVGARGEFDVSSTRNSVIFQARDLFTKKHFDIARSIYALRHEIRDARQKTSTAVDQWQFQSLTPPSNAELAIRLEVELTTRLEAELVAPQQIELQPR